MVSLGGELEWPGSPLTVRLTSMKPFSTTPKKSKAELLQEDIFFLIHLFARDVLVMKKLEIKKTKHTFIISVLKVKYWVVLVSLIFGFCINKMSLANKWMRKKFLRSVIYTVGM